MGFVLICGQAAHAQPAEPDTEDTSNAGDEEEAAEPGDAGDASEVGGGPGDRSTTVVDFGDEEAFGVGEVMASEDLRPIKRESLLRKKLRGPEPGSVATESGAGAGSRRVAAGIRAGVSIAGFAGAGAADMDASLGGAIGGFLVYRVSRRLAIQPELALDIRGALASGADMSRLAYVSVPVLARLLLPAGGMEVSAGLGPSLGISLTSRVGETEIARLDLGANAALGVSTPAGLALDLRYEHGLGDVIASSVTMYSGAVRNRSVSLTAGYMF